MAGVEPLLEMSCVINTPQKMENARHNCDVRVSKTNGKRYVQLDHKFFLIHLTFFIDLVIWHLYNCVVIFQVSTAVEIQVEVYWIMKLCSIVARYGCFGGSCCFQLQGEVHYGPPKRWHFITTLHGITTQKNSNKNL
jgi:hypothetical protein